VVNMRFQLKVLFSLLFLSSLFFQPGFVHGVPYLEEWGIYRLDPSTQSISLIYSCPDKLDNIKLNTPEDTFAFARYYGGNDYEYSEICTMNIDGTNLRRLTDNDNLDVFPSWSPDGSEIAFLSWRDTTMDIWIMDSDGGNQRLLYDSGYHDGDLHWLGDKMAFTRNSQIWIMDSDGSNPRQLTDPPRAGEWGNAVLPFGDYDPRISPDGSKVVFERLMDDTSSHGNYDLFVVNIDRTGETRLTETGWTQGIASWSGDGNSIIYLVSAKGNEGVYDIYSINADGSGMKDLTSSLFPDSFLTHSVLYAKNEDIYFVGQWYDWKILDSTLTLKTASDSYEAGNSVTLSGTLSPKVEEATIQLSTISPSGETQTYSVPAMDGKYSYQLDVNEVGKWSVEASWMGDAGHTEAGDSIEFNVVESPEPGGGVPGFSTASIMLGVLVALFALKSSFGSEKTGKLPKYS
jgi:Tol biopolymer transport system component